MLMNLGRTRLVSACDFRRRHADCLAGTSRCQEGAKVGDRARRGADLDAGCSKCLSGEIGRNDLDLLDGLQAHFAFDGRVAEPGMGAESLCKHCLSGRIHYVACRIEGESGALAREGSGFRRSGRPR